MSALRAVAAGFAFALVSVLPAQAATVYKWTNEQGVVQYTDAPPEGRQFQKLDIGGGVARSGASETEAPATAATDAAATPQSESMQRACEAAQANVEKFEQNQVVLMDLDGDGQNDELTPLQREEQLTRNQNLVKRFCRA
jgi:hypothetical protein